MADVLVRKLPYGRGVFAARQFQQGECVLETAGQIVATRSIYTIQIDHDKHIEPNPPVKYLNHACDPNLGVKINARGLPDFYAMRPIQLGEHLTFDYAMTEYVLTEMEHGHERLVCACGAATCRGHLGSYHELPSEIKRRYTGWIADYLNK